MEKLRGVQYKLSTARILAALLLVVLLVALVPMVQLTFYAYPLGDDYSLGAAARHAAVNGSFSEFVSSVLDTVSNLYCSWQGTYSATVMWASYLAIFGSQYYFVGLIFLTLLCVTSIFALTRALGKNLLNMRMPECIIVASVISLLFTQFLPSATAGFYWYNGALL